MKKYLLLFSAICLFALTASVQGQVINPGFETWSSNLAAPSAMSPNTGNASTGWWDFNNFNNSFVGSSPISVTRCSDTVHSGSYSARIQTQVYTPTSWNIYKSWGIPYIGHEYSDTLGILFNGTVDMLAPTYTPGIPFTQRITEFKFYYQYRPAGSDTAECRVSLWNSGDLIAGGLFKTGIGTGTSGWNQANLTMYYISPLSPDSMYVLMSASSLDHNPKPGSVLWVDDVSVALPTGIDDVTEADAGLNVFPNPSKGIFSVQQNSFAKNSLIEVYNVLGEVVYSSNLAKVQRIDLSDAPKGVYFVKVSDDGKSRTKKIVLN